MPASPLEHTVATGPPAATAAPATDPGALPYNQDRAFVHTDAATGITTVGIFDGHGTYGAEAAAAAAATMSAAPPTADATALFAEANAAIRTAILDQLRKTAINHMEEAGAIYRVGFLGHRGAPVRGGTTASLLRIQPDGSLIAAHVGDSDIVFWDTDDAPGTVLVADHTPTASDEAARIRTSHPRTGFRFASTSPSQPPRPVWTPTPHDPGKWELNPRGGYFYADVRSSWGAYVDAPDNTESIAMTRALGDFNLQRHGISPIPSVLTATPPPKGATRAIVAASDGLWDPAEYHEVRDIVRRPDLLGNAPAATAALMEWGRARAKARFGGGADNLTLAVVYCCGADGASNSVCPLHGAPPAEGEPPTLTHSKNSHGEYSTFAPLCTC